MTWRPSRTPRECREIKEQYTVGRFVIHSYGNGKQFFLVTKNPCISFSAINPNVCTQKNEEPTFSCRLRPVGSFTGRGSGMGWVLRLVESGTDDASGSVDVLEIERPGDLGDLANLGLTHAEGKQLLARIQ